MWMQGQDGGCIPCGARPPVVTPLDTIDCIYSRADNTILVRLALCISLLKSTHKLHCKQLFQAFLGFFVRYMTVGTERLVILNPRWTMSWV